MPEKNSFESSEIIFICNLTCGLHPSSPQFPAACLLIHFALPVPHHCQGVDGKASFLLNMFTYIPSEYLFGFRFAPKRKKALENSRFTGFSRASRTFYFRKLHSHATVANLTFAFHARFAKQRCIASNYSSSASFGLDSLSFQPSVLQLLLRNPLPSSRFLLRSRNERIS